MSDVVERIRTAIRPDAYLEISGATIADLVAMLRDAAAEITRLRERTEWRRENCRLTNQKPAFYTCDATATAGYLYYFGITNCTPPPYRTQSHVKAIIDVASDGTLAGVELIDDMPPPPGDKT